MTLNSRFRSMFTLNRSKVNEKYSDGIKEIEDRRKAFLSQIKSGDPKSQIFYRKAQKDFDEARKKLDEKRNEELRKLKDSLFLRQQKERHNKIFKKNDFR